MFRGVSLISTLFLGACATTLPLGSDVGDSPVVVDASSLDARSNRSRDVSCVTIIRDLSVDWDARDYWCDDGRLMVRQTVLLASLEKARRQLAALRQSAESIERNTGRAVARIDARLAGESRTVPVSAVEVPVVRKLAHTSRTSRSQSRQRVPGIVFARGRVVLGPQGRRAVAALAKRVASAQHVTVRGHLTENEFPLANPLDAERRSVGRSLSVREAWRSAGVDVSSVTILHHSGKYAGAYVEVVFGD